MQRFENIENKMTKELQKIDKKLENEGTEMSAQDIEMADCLFHALASAEKYYMMSEEGEMGFSGNYGSGGSYGRGSGGYSGNSYARGRDSRGRYTSREEGYSGYPPMYPRYPSYDDGMSMRY